MKYASKVFIGLFVLFEAGILLLRSNLLNRAISLSRKQADTQPLENNEAAQTTSGISVGEAVIPGVSKPIRGMPVASIEQVSNEEGNINPRQNPLQSSPLTHQKTSRLTQ